MAPGGRTWALALRTRHRPPTPGHMGHVISTARFTTSRLPGPDLTRPDIDGGRRELSRHVVTCGRRIQNGAPCRPSSSPSLASSLLSAGRSISTGASSLVESIPLLFVPPPFTCITASRWRSATAPFASTEATMPATATATATEPLTPAGSTHTVEYYIRMLKNYDETQLTRKIYSDASVQLQKWIKSLWCR